MVVRCERGVVSVGGDVWVMVSWQRCIIVTVWGRGCVERGIWI